MADLGNTTVNGLLSVQGDITTTGDIKKINGDGIVFSNVISKIEVVKESEYPQTPDPYTLYLVIEG